MVKGGSNFTKRCQCEWSIQQNVCVQSPRCHWLSEDGIIIVTTSKNCLGQLPPGERGHIRWWRTRTISAVNSKYLTGCRCDDKLDITSLELYIHLDCCGLYFIAVPAPTSDHAGWGWAQSRCRCNSELSREMIFTNSNWLVQFRSWF